MQLTEINRLWKHEYDLLKTKYLREKGALQEENKVLRAEVATLKTKLERSSKNVHEDTLHDNFLSHENKRQELCNRNHNVEELMKEQVISTLLILSHYFLCYLLRKKFEKAGSVS